MLTVLDYDESQDLFIIEHATTGVQFPVDATALANLLNTYDEPHVFIGMTFSVQVQA